jgi:hypothetical protein
LTDKESPESGAQNPQSSTAGRRSSFEESFSPDGVDLTLIRWMLSLSPRERLLAAQAAARAILRLRNARSDS